MSSVIVVKKRGRQHLANRKTLVWEEYGGTCANLVQWFGCNRTSIWRQGAIVKGNLGVEIGTCIATFENGKYPNKVSGNHAAVYISQNGRGITVYDQWSSLANPISREILFKDDMKDPSNNGNCFSVILTTPNRRAPGYKYVKLASNPATTPDSKRVLEAVIRKPHDKTVRKALERALRDEVLTYDDVKAIIRSAADPGKKGRLYNLYELQAMKIVLDRARTLDDKSRKLLSVFLTSALTSHIKL
jgi:hypothetical protein